LNFTHLLAFYEVARAGSVSAGAEVLHVSQPAITREIKELEQRLGLVLFDRLPRGVALTQAGSQLFDYAGRISEYGTDNVDQQYRGHQAHAAGAAMHRLCIVVEREGRSAPRRSRHPSGGGSANRTRVIHGVANLPLLKYEIESVRVLCLAFA
jgi:Mn-dependent DtxR family transcriptional regulator